jgi:hypothetical protein
MRRPAIRRLTAAGAALAILASLGLGAGTAMADPVQTPSLTTLVGVGSDTLAPLFDQGTVDQPKGDAPGTLVHDYNATKPAYPVASWDAVNPVTGLFGQTIAAKAASSSDTSCDVYRPEDSSAGIAELNQYQLDQTMVGGQNVYCLDYARSARPPNTTTYADAFVTLARDAFAWSYPTVSGETNPQPKSLSRAQLIAIYICQDTNWDQVGGKDAPIGVVVPQSFADTRAMWLFQLGITAAAEPCWQNGTVTSGGVTYAINADTGLSTGNVLQFTSTQTIDNVKVPAADDIFPYSIGDWIAQGAKTDGVGGHATSIWGHGNLHLGETANVAGKPEVAVTKNSSGQPVINPDWDPQFLNILYAVTRNGCYDFADPDSTAVCLPSSTTPPHGMVYPTYEVKGLTALFGPKGWVCTSAAAKADILSYGFTRLPTCGVLTAGD